MNIIKQTEKRVTVWSDKIGQVQLSRFSDDFDHGLYRNVPWHVTCFGRNFATIPECINFLQEIEDHWDDESIPERQPCHAEMTHSFLSLEADLDCCQ